MQLDGEHFARMVFSAARRLHTNVKTVDALNVFPVPDGDTGTNMNLTLSTGVDELRQKLDAHLGQAAATLARGLLMGARGNSGVILSQLFRGFSRSVNGKAAVTARQFAEALKAGVDTAYQAVMKPVEGTILTVAREAAEAALRAARRTDDIALVMEQTLEAARVSLSRTPELLPVLKQVGVVDSGGQGLVFIYEGFLASLTGEEAEPHPAGTAAAPPATADMDRLVEEHHRAQLGMKTEDIRYGYCTEFMIWLVHSTEPNKKPFSENAFRAALDAMGDSLLVVSDGEMVKVHIHAENPGSVLNFAQQYGSLHRIKIDNMREQHGNILREEAQKAAAADEPSDDVAPASQAHQRPAPEAAPAELLPYGLIAVAAGSGIADMFRSLGVHVVVEGGQTMNPSTEDFVKAMDQLHAERIIILPNNSNIIMAAQQAASLADRPVAVIPTKSVPQGMAALVAFNGSEQLESNVEAMTEAIGQVKTGLVTHAVRDTEMGGLAIKEGDYIGIADGSIVTSDPDVMTTARQLLEHLVDEETGIVTIIYGEDAAAEQAEALQKALEGACDDVEVEVIAGGQPLYPFILAVE